MSLVFVPFIPLTQDMNGPTLLRKIRTYGEVKAVSISPDGEYVVAHVYTGYAKKELQFYRNSTLLWKRDLDLWQHLMGFSADGQCILVQESGLIGYKSYVNLILFDMSGEIVENLSIVSPGEELAGGKITGTPLYWGLDISYADNGYIALTDKGESEYHDKGVCVLDADGKMIWRYTLDYPKEYDDVWISHSSKYVLARTSSGNYHLFDTAGHLLFDSTQEELIGTMKSYYPTCISFSLNDTLIAFFDYDKFILCNDQFDRISAVKLDEYGGGLDTAGDFFSENDDIVIRLGYYKDLQNYDSTIILMQPNGVIRWVERFNIGTTYYRMSAVDMTPDGKYLVIGSKDTYIYLFTDFPETVQLKPEDSTFLWLIAGITSVAVLIIAIMYVRKKRRREV